MDEGTNAAAAGGGIAIEDGFVGRFVFGPIARPAARLAGEAGLSAGAFTWVALILAVGSGVLAATGIVFEAGVCILLVTIGERAAFEADLKEGKRGSLGMALANVGQRYADAAILGGMTVYAVRFESHEHAEFAGMLALAGALIASFSRARMEADIERAGVASTAGIDGPFAFAGRDGMLLVAAVGTVVGECYWSLVVIAALSFATIAWRLAALRLRTHNPATP